jgi:hypothetical protein
MKFCTAINCMDGRVQIPVIEYLKRRFGAEYVDVVTEPGPNLILASQSNPALVESIFERIKISVEGHHSVGIAIVGHHGCAGNPAPKEEQISHIRDAMALVCRRYPKVELLGVWVDENWEVSELDCRRRT